MKVKVCPKCGAENRPEKESCSNCYGSLEGVELTESTREPVITSSQPTRPPRPPRGEPLTNLPGEPVRKEETPAQSFGESPFYSSRPPVAVKQGANFGVIFLVVILLAGGGFAGWWFFLKPPSPAQVVQRFLDACEHQDAERAKVQLSKSTLDKPGVGDAFVTSFIKAREIALQKGRTPGSAVTMKVVSTSYTDSDRKTAVVACQPLDEKGQPSKEMQFTFDWVLVKEEGGWKIDIEATVQKMFAKLFREMMEKGGKPPINVPPVR